jgi:chemotaxis signal transduction protein
MKELLLFHVGPMQYGIALPLVKSIQSAKPMVVDQIEDKNPLNRRGVEKETPLYDLLSIFEQEIASRDSKSEKLIIVETEPRPIGLIVSRVDQVVSADRSRIEPLSPVFKDSSLSCFSEVLKNEGSLVLLLKPEGIVKAVQKTIEPQICNNKPRNGNTSNAVMDGPFCHGRRRKQTQNACLDQKAG